MSSHTLSVQDCRRQTNSVKQGLRLMLEEMYGCGGNKAARCDRGISY